MRFRSCCTCGGGGFCDEGAWAPADGDPANTKNSSARLPSSRAGASWSRCILIIETAAFQRAPVCGSTQVLRTEAAPCRRVARRWQVSAQPDADRIRTNRRHQTSTLGRSRRSGLPSLRPGVTGRRGRSDGEGPAGGADRSGEGSSGMGILGQRPAVAADAADQPSLLAAANSRPFQSLQSADLLRRRCTRLHRLPGVERYGLRPSLSCHDGRGAPQPLPARAETVIQPHPLKHGTQKWTCTSGVNPMLWNAAPRPYPSPGKGECRL